MLTALNGRFTNGFFDQLADHVELSFKLRFVQHVPSDEHLAHEGLSFPGLTPIVSFLTGTSRQPSSVRLPVR